MKQRYFFTKCLSLSVILLFSSLTSFAKVNEVWALPPDTSTVIVGCMDSTSLNYNPNATVSDTSCIAKVYGCMDPNSSNYNPQANVSDGSCLPADTSTVIVGCMDSTSLNYNPNATVSDTSCIAKVYGCMDSNSSNYNPLANISDGSCIPSDTSTVIVGCMDPNAFNYNPYATQSDTSCVLNANVTLGCTDPKSLNYNASATKNDGSCKYADTVTTISGCMDPLAYNYNGLANKMDNSCLYKAIQKNSSIVTGIILQDTVGTVVFNNCVINYSLPIINASIESLNYIGNDSVKVTWGIYQTDGKKIIHANYYVQVTGAQLFILSVTCSNTPQILSGPTLRTTTNQPNVNTFGDVANVLSVTGVKNSAANSIQFNLYPQPADQYINYTVQQTGTLTVMNLLGETVLTVDVNSMEGQLNVSNLTTGTYLYKFTNKSGQSVGKLIKQ